MAERELAILLRAKDLASKTVGKVKGEITSLGAAGSKAMNGLTTAIKRVGMAAAVGLVGAIALGVRSLGQLERITNQTNAVLESTGGVSGQTAEAIREHAQALEQLTTADDKAIQEGQNLLLTFTKIGGKTFPAATDAVVNMAIAMAKGDVATADFAGTAIQVGKALNDPLKGITALSKAGVSFTQQQKDQIKTLVKAGKIEEAQAIILKELATEFGNAGEAAGTGFEADMRRVQDAGEDATAALARGVMPALTRVTAWLSKKLADPAVLKAIDELGQGLGDAADAALDFVETVDFKAIGDGLVIAKNAASGIVSAFMSMPDWVKTAVITGWGLNKLTGGLVGELGKGLIKGVLGMTAGVVNINAGVVNGGGGLPGAAAGGGLVAAGAAVAAPVLSVAAVGIAAKAIQDRIDTQGAGLVAKAGTFAATSSDAQLAQAIAGIKEQLSGQSFNTFDQKNKIVDTLNVLIAEQNRRATEGSLDSAALRAGVAASKEAASLDSVALRGATDAAKIGAANDSAALRAIVSTTAAATKAEFNAGTQRSVAAQDATKAAVAQAAAASRMAGQQVAAEVRDKDLSVNTTLNVSTTVSVRDTIKKTFARTKFGAIAV